MKPILPSPLLLFYFFKNTQTLTNPKLGLRFFIYFDVVVKHPEGKRITLTQHIAIRFSNTRSPIIMTTKFNFCSLAIWGGKVGAEDLEKISFFSFSCCINFPHCQGKRRNGRNPSVMGGWAFDSPIPGRTRAT